MVKEGIKNFGKKFGSAIANSFGKAIYKIKEKGIKPAGKSARKVKEHFSHNQFNLLVWIGLIYYIFQWIYKIVFEPDIFSNVPYEFMIINSIIAFVVLSFCFKPDFEEYIGAGLIIGFYILIIQTGFTMEIIPIIGANIETLVWLIIITAGVAVIWRHVLHKDIFGMLSVSLVFLLEIGFKVFLASQTPLPILIDFLLYMPYWLLLGIFAGSYTIGGASKPVRIARVIFVGGLIFFIAGNLFSTGTTYGATKFSIDPEKQQEGRDAWETSWERFTEGIEKMTAPILCIGPDWEECIAKKTAPKKELTEKETLSFSINRDREQRVNIYVSSPDISSYGFVYATVEGDTSEPKKILFFCDVNKNSGKTNPEWIITEGDNKIWKKDIECIPSNLESSNDIEIGAGWRQETETRYVNYLTDYDMLNAEKKEFEYITKKKKCSDELCLKNVEKDFYKSNENFKNKIINNYPDFKTSSIIDNEVVGLLLHTEYVPVIGIKKGEETKIDLIIQIANMGQGEIEAVHDILIETPTFIEKTENCDILEGENGKFEFKKDSLNKISWSKVKSGEEEQERIGKCEFRIDSEDVRFPNMNILNTITIRGSMNFEYQLKSKKENVRHYG